MTNAGTTREETPGGAAWFCYLLQCGDGSLYCGMTNNPTKRLRAHNLGKASRYTRSRLPTNLVYLENCEDRAAACAREIAIKRLSREEKRSLAEAAWRAAKQAGNT